VLIEGSSLVGYDTLSTGK